MSGTITAEGAIPHLVVQYDGGKILAPVKLRPDASGEGIKKGRLGGSGPVVGYPLRRDGKLVYALPGGREVVA